MDATSILATCSWVAHISYTVCFLPQIATNYRVKSGSGVSELLLIGYLNLHALFLYYIFALGLPLAYKICVPLQLAFVLVLIVQRLWYEQQSGVAKRLGILYLANSACLVAVMPYALANPIAFGNVGGWVVMALGFFSQAPQAIKMWRDRSVAGFDKSFVYILLLAGAAELTGALVGGLPLQTKLSACRVLFFGAVFLWQFRCFAKPDA